MLVRLTVTTQCDRLPEHCLTRIYLATRRDMSVKIEQIYISTWADTRTVSRSQFTFDDRAMLVASYNKANTCTINALYIIHILIPQVGQGFSYHTYHICIWSFVNLNPSQLESLVHQFYCRALQLLPIR